jgi:hypothetical membrane protein
MVGGCVLAVAGFLAVLFYAIYVEAWVSLWPLGLAGTGALLLGGAVLGRRAFGGSVLAVGLVSGAFLPVVSIGIFTEAGGPHWVFFTVLASMVVCVSAGAIMLHFWHRKDGQEDRKSGWDWWGS